MGGHSATSLCKTRREQIVEYSEEKIHIYKAGGNLFYMKIYRKCFLTICAEFYIKIFYINYRKLVAKVFQMLLDNARAAPYLFSILKSTHVPTVEKFIYMTDVTIKKKI